MLFHTLLRAFGRMRQVMDGYFAQYGISGPQWAVLSILHRAEQEGKSSLRLTDLGQRLLIQPPSVTGVIDRIERQGLVRRLASQTDLRSRHVSLTDQGRQLVERVLPGRAQQIRSLFAGLSEPERAGLTSTLEKLESQLGQLASDAARTVRTKGPEPAEE